MTSAFPRGSEWRKWDLHLHAPGGTLNDGYDSSEEGWDRYCAVLANSDVAVFGITDYFSLDPFFKCREEFLKRYPDTSKVFFPNLELRLNEAVNKEIQVVDIHLVLRPDLDREAADRLLIELKTELIDSDSQRPLSCADLNTTDQYERATVTRQSLKQALETAFGTAKPLVEHALRIVPANNNGIRASSGQRRRAALADEIDRAANAIFGSQANAGYFLNPHRREDDALALPKPVFSGCDAHNLADLEAWLGQDVSDSDNRKSVTWIKADPTFEGLLQTLVEPRARVQIQPARPDQKEPYKYISAVRFAGTDEFPDAIPLNQNLVSIIGSRATGKSALLAYIAHAVDPDYAVERQLAAQPSLSPSDVGPAPGKTWAEVSEIDCTVEWGDPDTARGRVIYIPQNALYAISERPAEITAKIRPTLYRLDPDFEVAYGQMETQVEASNETLKGAVSEWYRLSSARDAARTELLDIGDRKAIERTRADLQKRIADLRAASSLTTDESDTYQRVVDELRAVATRQKAVEQDLQRLAPHLDRLDDGRYRVKDSVGVDVRLTPATLDLPDELHQGIASLLERARGGLLDEVRGALAEFQQSLDAQAVELREREASLRSDNKLLMDKNRANGEIESLVDNEKRQADLLTQIDEKSRAIDGIDKALEGQVGVIDQALKARTQALTDLSTEFASKSRELPRMTFDLEQELAQDARDWLADRVNRRASGPFTANGELKIEVCQESPKEFLAAIRSGEQKLRAGYSGEDFAADVLAATPELRFAAEIEGDRIGGFGASSMTPGKQALFALTLILNESEEAWPLLIDQPEDDLDSRSIYDVLVGYLAERKTERQIIMVSHDANLVVGADSEQVIVANRHGADRKNRGGQAFDYFAGSLEHSCERRDSEIVFDLGGIREHSCDLLDGGEEAFRKRRLKYKL